MTRGLGVPTGPSSVADHERRIRELERAMRPRQFDLKPRRSSGGRPYATVVVAASDSYAAGKESADFVCDGTPSGDYATMSAALAAIDGALSPSGLPGRAVLLEGFYRPDQTLEVPLGAVVEGQGKGTLVRGGAATVWEVLGHVCLGHMSVDSTPPAILVNLISEENMVYGLYMLPGSDDRTGVHITAARNLITGCFFRGLAVGIDQEFGIGTRILGNSFLLGRVDIAIGGNDGLVANNLLYGCENDASDNDGIVVTGDTNFVVGNVVRNGTLGEYRYAVNIVSGATDNAVVGNDLRAGGSTTPISDAGTGSLLTWPNDATYGDNFT